MKNIDKNKKEVTDLKENNNKKRYILIILFIFILIMFLFSFTYGKNIYNSLENQIIETFKLDKPTSPVIDGGSKEWEKEQIIKVSKDSYAKNSLDYYEYCVSNSANTNNCSWNRTDTKNIKISTSGKYYVTFRAVDKKGNKGNLSNTEVVFIDNQNPVINKIEEKEITSTSIKVEVSAKDEHSGINEYYYSLDGTNYVKGDIIYNYDNLEANKQYTIYVKVIDKAGNKTF